MLAIVRLKINGDEYETGVPEHYTLLEALRYGIGLTGSKQGCDKGDCGACTVLLDGQPVLSCITPVWEAENHEVLTVEGIASPAGLHPLQDAFEANGAAQCGFCTPGILMSAYALLARTTSPTRAEVLDALAGNLCRCTGYTKIIEAVESAAVVLREGTTTKPSASSSGSASASKATATAVTAGATSHTHAPTVAPPNTPEGEGL